MSEHSLTMRKGSPLSARRRQEIGFEGSLGSALHPWREGLQMTYAPPNPGLARTILGRAKAAGFDPKALWEKVSGYAQKYQEGPDFRKHDPEADYRMPTWEEVAPA